MNVSDGPVEKLRGAADRYTKVVLKENKLTTLYARKRGNGCVKLEISYGQ